ncbi:MAG: hypothetical protein JSR93_01130 [Verrucomicrobia bacterium]|nr:hypothetical protein [Verrucomicrobiota bacterium]
MPIKPITNLRGAGSKVLTCLTAFSLLLVPALSGAYPSAEKQNIETEQHQTFSYITPPAGWEIADPKFLAKSVQIAFLKKSGAGFCPSVNLAIEKSNLSLPEYLNVIRQIHESDKRNRWRQLGKVHTQSGIGQLTEIDTDTEFGPVRMLQLILIKQGCTYVVTAAALKDEIAQYYKDFQATFRSLQITSDLISTVPQMERRDSLKERSERLISSWQKAVEQGVVSLAEPNFQKENWLPFQNAVLQDFEDMGPHWQILMLKSIQEKMIALVPPLEVKTEEVLAELSSLNADELEENFLAEETVQIADADENVTELNETSSLADNLSEQEISIDLTTATPHTNDLISDDSGLDLSFEEEPLSVSQNVDSEMEVVDCNEPLSEEALLGQEEQATLPVDSICHAEETLLNTSSILPSESLIEDGQNTP